MPYPPCLAPTGPSQAGRWTRSTWGPLLARTLSPSATGHPHSPGGTRSPWQAAGSAVLPQAGPALSACKPPRGAAPTGPTKPLAPPTAPPAGRQQWEPRPQAAGSRERLVCLAPQTGRLRGGQRRHSCPPPRGARPHAGSAGALPQQQEGSGPRVRGAPTLGLVLAVQHDLEGVGGQRQTRVHQERPLLPHAVLGDGLLGLQRDMREHVAAAGAPRPCFPRWPHGADRCAVPRAGAEPP